MTVQFTEAYYRALADLIGEVFLGEKNMAGILNVIEAIREAVLAGKMPGKSLGDVIQAGVECANEVDGLKRTLAEKEAMIASLQTQVCALNETTNGLRVERFAEAQRALKFSLQSQEGRRLDALRAKLHVFSFLGMFNEPGSSCKMEELGTLVKVTSRGETMIRLGNGPHIGENHQLKDGEEVYFTLHQVALGDLRVTSGNVAQATITALEQKLQVQKNRADRMTKRVEETECMVYKAETKRGLAPAGTRTSSGAPPVKEEPP